MNIRLRINHMVMSGERVLINHLFPGRTKNYQIKVKSKSLPHNMSRTARLTGELFTCNKSLVFFE